MKKVMTEAYKTYHDTFMAETAALIDLLGSILAGSRTADEINRQADRHFENLDNAVAKYYEDFREEKENGKINGNK